jgi:hypothetical protein
MNNKLKFTVAFKNPYRNPVIIEGDGYDFSHMSPFVVFYEHPRDKDGRITTEKKKDQVFIVHEDQVLFIDPKQYEK